MSICMRVFNHIECPTCGYPQAEARYSLDEAPYDPGCRYEKDTIEVPDIGPIELEDDSDDLHEFVRLHDEMADEMLQQSYFGG